ncbi:MAG TPA: hemerythrin domain-containing protein [Mycobacteriales bacterium]
MTEISNLPLADTSDMIGLHRVFREALAAAPQLVGGAAPGDAGRAELVGSYYDNVLRLLDGHHAGEDELVTPRLLERCPDEAATIARIFAQHDEVHGAISRAHACVATWRERPTAANASELVAALAALDAALTPHLDEEERTVLPLAARCISVVEWGELPGHGMRSFDGDKLWLIRGLIREQMTPAQRASMDANTPPPVAAMWAEMGEAAFADFVVRLRGLVPSPRNPADEVHADPVG